MARGKQLDLESALTDNGDIIEKEAPIKKYKEEVEKAPESYTFEQVGEFMVRDGVTIYPKMCTIPNTDVVLDPGKGKYRSIRYLIGVDTIWEDEQGDMDKQALKRLTPRRFQLTDGKLVVDANDKAQLEFLMLSNYNEGTKDRVQGKFPLYRLVDNTSKEEQALQFMKASRKAAAIAEDASEEDMMIHVSYLGIQTVDNGQNKSKAGIRAAYIKYASENPKMFLKSYQNPLAKVFVQVRNAIVNGVISTTKVKGQAHWAETDALIITIPEGKNEVDFLANYATSAEGKSFKERLAELS